MCYLWGIRKTEWADKYKMRPKVLRAFKGEGTNLKRRELCIFVSFLHHTGNSSLVVFGKGGPHKQLPSERRIFLGCGTQAGAHFRYGLREGLSEERPEKG